MNPIILVAESGSDIKPEAAKKHDIHIVPMHVAYGGQTRDDGSFPVSEMFEHYAKTRDLPRTSGCTPHDFEEAFDRLQKEYPGQPILHLAYSACTTCSMQSAVLAAEDREGILSVDTKHVSVGQAAVVLAVYAYLQENPDCTMEQAVQYALEIREKVQMCFLPKNLDYLRAGGRVSNAAAMMGNFLGLHPCIEILDGRLMAKKKYRGALTKVVPKLIHEYSEKNALQKDHIRFIWSPGVPDDLKRLAEETAAELGFKKVTWMRTGCVITCHGGPGAFGIVGTAANG